MLLLEDDPRIPSKWRALPTSINMKDYRILHKNVALAALRVEIFNSVLHDVFFILKSQDGSGKAICHRACMTCVGILKRPAYYSH